jgi:hypothetical protein
MGKVVGETGVSPWRRAGGAVESKSSQSAAKRAEIPSGRTTRKSYVLHFLRLRLNEGRLFARRAHCVWRNTVQKQNKKWGKRSMSASAASFAQGAARK